MFAFQYPLSTSDQEFIYLVNIVLGCKFLYFVFQVIIIFFWSMQIIILFEYELLSNLNMNYYLTWIWTIILLEYELLSYLNMNYYFTWIWSSKVNFVLTSVICNCWRISIFPRTRSVFLYILSLLENKACFNCNFLYFIFQIIIVNSKYMILSDDVFKLANLAKISLVSNVPP